MSMQQHATNKQSKKKRPPLNNLIKTLGAVRRLRPKQAQKEDVEHYIDSLKGVGAPEGDLPIIKDFMIASLEALRDEEAYHRVDRYVVGGISAVDLVLFGLFISVGIHDTQSFVSLLAWAISFPCAAGSLFFSFMKTGNNIVGYGRIHGTLSMLAVTGGGISIAALVMHISVVVGIIFSLMAFFVYIICASYSFIVKLRLHAASTHADQQQGGTTHEQGTTGSTQEKQSTIPSV